MNDDELEMLETVDDAFEVEDVDFFSIEVSDDVYEGELV